MPSWWLTFAFLALQTPAAPVSDPPAAAPRSLWANASNLELVADERHSLKGVSRLALSVNLPDSIAGSLPADAIASTISFQLDQAGLTVTTTRAVEDPLLVVSVRTVADEGARGTGGRVVYRVYADLLQLVRLADHDGAARLMMASTWHAGSFGTVPVSATGDLRVRIAEIVDAFLADHRWANRSTSTPAVP